MFHYLELKWPEIFTYFICFVSGILTPKSTLRPKLGGWKIYIVYCSLIILFLSGKLLTPIPCLSINPSRKTSLSLTQTELLMSSSGLYWNLDHTSDITVTFFFGLHCFHPLDCDSNEDKSTYFHISNDRHSAWYTIDAQFITAESLTWINMPSYL